MPNDATVVYENNLRTEPGSQTAKATITYYGVEYKYQANLSIAKCASSLAVDEVQTIESGENLKYTLNNDEQEISYEVIYQPGTYTVSVYALESDYYSKSDKYKITVTVEEAKPLGITFSSTTMTADGTEKELLASNIPEGYSVKYSNNKMTEVGKQYAVCTVLNGEGNEVATIKAIFTLENEENKEFTKFLDGFLLDYLGDDYFAWNIYFVNPEAVGFDRSEFGDPEWYSYTKFDEEFRGEALQDFVDIHDELITYKNALLSSEQKIAYTEIDEFINFYLDYYAVDGDWQYQLENLSYVDQFGGYCSDFGTSMEGYTYRDEDDVKDVLSYVKSTAIVYPTYVTYANDRIEAGYPLSDYTLSEMIDYLQDIVDKGEDFYLIEYIQGKFNKLDFLDAEQKTAYTAQVKEYFVTYFLPANESLMEGLKKCKGHITSFEDEGYLAKYENGEELFIAKLRDLTGNPNLDIDEYNEYIDKKLKEYSSITTDIVAQYRAMGSTQAKLWYSYIDGTSFVDITKPEEMIPYLKEFAKTIVPDLGVDINVLVKYMDETEAKKSNAVAYYMRSAIDSLTDEYITLNGLKTTSDYNDTLSTMAHEGYPGHLYAHVFIKDTSYPNILKVMSSTTFSEGWATYVQLKLYEYIKENVAGLSSSNKKTMDLAVDYLYYNQLAGYLLYCKIDEMIHVEHATIDEIVEYTHGVGYSSITAASVKEIYRTLIEMPTGYTPYGYGQICMNDLHIYCEKELGSLYNEVDYNAFVLSTTQDSLYNLQVLTEEYIKDVKFMYGTDK